MISKAFLLLTVAIAVASAIVCPPNYCDRVDCEELTDCEAANGLKVREKGSFCKCCDICVTLLGEGERCQPEGLFRGVIIKSECAEGLFCDMATWKCMKVAE